MSPPTCIYEKDVIIQFRSKKFKCDQESLEGEDLCLFHDEGFLKGDVRQENKDKVIEKLNDRIDKSIANNEPLYCIGYYLPDLEIKREFKRPVWFSHCKFQLTNFSGATFSDKADFSGATFLDKANFGDAIFSAEADFRKTKFKRANFYRTKFKETYFADTIFSSLADFSGATFSDKSNFCRAEFKEANFSWTEFKEANFYDTTFSDKANFVKAAFSDKANFGDAIFSAEADFRKTKFKKTYFRETKFKKTYFAEATFSDLADFSGATFEDKVSFYVTKFENEADFSGTIFKYEASFYGTTFEAGANFFDVTFKYVDFYCATFGDKANLYRSPFFITTFKAGTNSSEIRFSNNTDSNSANFTGATFQAKVIFTGATFQAEVNFNKAESLGTTFKAKANFSGSTFKAKANFIGATFGDEANFTMTKFLAESLFAGSFQGRTYFDYVTFGKPNEVRFEIENMSLVSFMNSDIIGIRFSGKTRWSKDNRFKVVEEEELEIELEYCKNQRSNLEEILSVYRNLRENYEIRRRYDEAGKFFIREMEIKRKYRIESKDTEGYKIKKNHPVRRNVFSLIGWYHILSNYGESLKRPTIAGIMIVILATFFFVCQSNPTLAPVLPSISDIIKSNSNNHTSNIQNIHRNHTIINSATFSRFIGLSQIINGSHWSKAAERSLGDFLPLLSMPSDIKIGLTDYIVKIVGGAVTFGLIAIALRRRFERKYTH